MGLLDRQYEVRKILARVFYKVPSDIMSQRDRARVEEFFQDVTEDNKNLRRKIKELRAERDRYKGEVEELGRMLDGFE